MAAVILDVIVIVLLVTTIAFCLRLNNKIVELKSSRKDLTNLVKTFDMAIIKTHKNIADLKSMSATSSDELQSYVSKASELIDDLSFMTDTAAKLADRLERGIKESRGQGYEEGYSNLDDMINDNENEMKTGSFAKTRNDLLEAIKIARQG